MIVETLEAAGLSPRDLSGVAACTGPGNFTGVRMAVAAARGLALGAGAPACGVPRLSALAAAAGAEGGRLAVSAAATRGRVYLQMYDDHGAATEISLLETEAALQHLREDGGARVIGPLAEGREPPGSTNDLADPVWIARLGAKALTGSEPPPRPAPIYLRPPDAAPSSDAPPPRLSDGR